nr:Nuclear valosin-containing protein [Ipomoea batatas]
MFRGDDYSQTLGIDAAERDGAYIIRWKSGKRVDPRLLTLLESFRDVFDKREDFFKKIFPGIYEEFKDVFGKFSMIKGQKREMKTRALERSSSLGSARGLRLERFRVKTPNVTVVTGPQDGEGPVSFAVYAFTPGDLYSVAKGRTRCHRKRAMFALLLHPVVATSLVSAVYSSVEPWLHQQVQAINKGLTSTLLEFFMDLLHERHCSRTNGLGTTMATDERLMSSTLMLFTDLLQEMKATNRIVHGYFFFLVRHCGDDTPTMSSVLIVLSTDLLREPANRRSTSIALRSTLI